MDADYYRVPALLNIIVEDSDLDITGSPDTTTVELISDIENISPKLVTLTETGNSTGIFTGSIKLTEKFLGNIGGGNNSGLDMPDNFGVYWNQVTTEDIGKWAEVEPVQDVMQWDNLDTIYNYAKDNGLPFKQHTFVWGNQQPGWITSLPKEKQELFRAFPPPEPKWMKVLSQQQRREEVEEWIRCFCQRYPDTDYIDVVNEPFNAPPSYKDALGGDGATGWDWVIWSFQKARQYCPNAKLLINEWGVLEGWGSASMAGYLEIINLLKNRGLIDGIGNQCHNLQWADMTTIADNLDIFAATGLPIYITEMDVVSDDDGSQLWLYENKFPVLWEHPSVGGITLWGYIQDMVWLADGYLIRTNGTERPALTWLKGYTSSPFGILRVKNGDTITVTYEDADDGTGNPVIVTATAAVSSIDTPTGLTATAGSNYVFLYWNPVEDPVLGGYNVYRSNSLTGTKTKVNNIVVGNNNYQNIFLDGETTYYYWVTAIDIYGDETDYSNITVVTTGVSSESIDEGDEDGGSGGSSAAPLESGCFIATACYGTPMAEEVKTLSCFRDEYLLGNSLGKFFVKAYYKTSPMIADLISEHPYLKNLVRWLLEPVTKITDKIIE